MHAQPGRHPGNRVSLQEAVDIANGVVADPFTDPWDDKDQVFEWICNEKRECHDDTGQEVCTCYYDEEPTSKSGPFYSYHISGYDIEIEQEHPGPERAMILRHDNRYRVLWRAATSQLAPIQFLRLRQGPQPVRHQDG